MNVVISVLVHLFVRLPIMSYRICLVCGIVFVILAPTLAGSALIAMKAAGTNVHPSEPSLAIVRGGPFRFTRNPMFSRFVYSRSRSDFSERLDHVAVRRSSRMIFHYGVVLREENISPRNSVNRIWNMKLRCAGGSESRASSGYRSGKQERGNESGRVSQRRPTIPGLKLSRCKR